MLRLLQTSDWHLGAALGETSRLEEQKAFLDWLLGAVAAHEVDVLLVAGDVFHVSQPSAEATRVYCDFLARAAATRLRRLVVVGGNHDSASRLEALAPVLAPFRVHVVGGLGADREDWSRTLCEIPGADGGLAAVIVAVPYVHESYLGVRAATEDGLPAQLREAHATLYRELADRAARRAGGAPLVATGHLVAGTLTQEEASGELEIIGTLAALPASVFDPRFAHVALGHLHRAHAVAERVWYSGTPIALNRVEARSPRQVLLVDLDAGAARVSRLEVPARRAILEVRGGLDDVVTHVARLAWETPLPPLVHVVLDGDAGSATADQAIADAFAAHGDGGPILVGVERRVALAPGAPGPQPLALESMTREDVFRRLCAERGVADVEELVAAFRTLLEEPQAEPGAA